MEEEGVFVPKEEPEGPAENIFFFLDESHLGYVFFEIIFSFEDTTSGKMTLCFTG